MYEAKVASGYFDNMAPDRGVQWSEGAEYTGPEPASEAPSDNRLTNNPNERSVFRNFPGAGPNGIGEEDYRDLIEPSVREELANVGVTDPRVVELVVAQSTQETNAGKSYFNFNPGGVREPSKNRPHVYVGGGTEETGSLEKANAQVASNKGAKLKNPEGPPPYVVQFQRSESELSRFAAYESVQEGVAGYINDTAIGNPDKVGAAQQTQAYLAQQDAKGNSISLKEYSEFYSRQLLNGGYYTAGAGNGRKATEADKQRASAGYARAIRNRLERQYPNR
jgi:hypothetical protein